MIKKHYTMDNSSEAFKLSQVIGKIEDSFKKETLNSEVRKQISGIWKGQEIIVQKTWGLPFTGKAKISEKWEILVTEKGWKKRILDEAEAKKFLAEPNIRQEILKQRIDNTSAKEALDNIKKKKWFEKLSWIGDAALELSIQRMRALVMSWLIWGLLTVSIEVFTWPERNETLSDSTIRLLQMFAIWAGFWYSF